jgi:hypothetical protein
LNGNDAPTRIITGASTTLNVAVGVAIGPDGREWLTTWNGTDYSLEVFAADAHGNVAPQELITGSSPTLDESWGVGVDSSGDLYVIDRGSSAITVYDTLRIAFALYCVGPTHGPTARETEVTIHGAALPTCLDVTFGGVPGTKVVRADSTTLTLTAPPQAAGLASRRRTLSRA